MTRIVVALSVPLILSVAASARTGELTAEHPKYRAEQVLAPSDDVPDVDGRGYLAFPALVRTEDGQVLISYKRGQSHAQDAGSVIEVLRFDPKANKVTSRRSLKGDPGLIYQMGEWVRFPGGRIGNYVDVQHSVEDRGARRHHRTGVEWASSDDGGKTFSPLKKLGPVDGVEYGYIFDAVESKGRVYMLAMSFPELSDRGSFFDADGQRLYGEVSVLATDDEGETWKHLRNLSREFGGININESALIADGDGFLVATRGYDSTARLHRVDGSFKLLHERNLSKENKAIGSHIGRPRLFRRDDGLYLLGRNHRDGKMELALIRVNPQTLQAERLVVLDPPDEKKMKDGYYAVHYFQESPRGRLLNVITYRRPEGTANPNIIRLEYLWDECK